MSWESYKQNIVWNKLMKRSDITPLFENPKVFRKLVKELSSQFSKREFDKIACLDALGFVLGSAIAFKLKKPLILIRKKDKFPNNKTELKSISFTDYTKKTKSFEIKKSSIKVNEKILIVDEWIDTGAQISATIELIESLGGKIVGVVTLFSNKNKKTLEIMKKYKIKAIKYSELK